MKVQGLALFAAAFMSIAAAAQAATPPAKADEQPARSAAPAATPVAPSTATPAAPGPAAPQTSDEEFSIRVKTMEEQVNDLKEKIFRTKARLLLLQESVLTGDRIGTQGAKATLIHRNEMGSSFYLESVAYALDGAPVYTKVDVDGDLDKKEEFEIFNGRIVPGQHQIAVKLQFRGHGFGIFSYLEGYKFTVKSSYTFDAEPGKITTVKIVARENGGITTDLKDRPSVRYDLERATDSALKKDKRPAAPGTDAPAPAPAPAK